jgi:uncharacterized BrkB/YihY/UPF0761 family membrane protein
MASERKIDLVVLMIFILSLTALLMLFIGPFAGSYLEGYGRRYSCLSCEYSSPVDLTMQILIIFLLIFQALISLNELLPKRIVAKDFMKFGCIFALLTWIVALVGLEAFGIAYWDSAWWAELGFYGTAMGGTFNTILFIFKIKNK